MPRTFILERCSIAPASNRNTYDHIAHISRSAAATRDGLRRRHGHVDPELRAQCGRRLRGQRELRRDPGGHAARCGPRDPRQLPGSRGGRDRDGFVRRIVAGAGGVRDCAPRARAEHGRGATGQGSGARVLHGGQAALRSGVDGADDQAAVAGAHRIRRDAGQLCGAGRGADRGRRGHAADRDLPGPAAT